MSTYPNDEDEGPAGEEDEVADEEAGDPDDGEAHVDELEALRRPRQEVPALELLRDEPLRDLVLDDGGDPRLDVVEDVLQLELRLEGRRRHLLAGERLRRPLLARLSLGLVGHQDQIVFAADDVVTRLLPVVLQERGLFGCRAAAVRDVAVARRERIPILVLGEP